MQAVHLVHRKALEQAFLQHDLRAAAAFLGGLENQVDGAVELPGLGEVARSAQKHRGVPVVAAGMHAALVLRAMRDVGRLVHRQAVHVGTQRNGAAARAAPAVDHADQAGLGEAAMHFDAAGGEALGDQARGARFLERELRMRVDIAPQLTELGVIAANALDRRAHIG